MSIWDELAELKERRVVTRARVRMLVEEHGAGSAFDFGPVDDAVADYNQAYCHLFDALESAKEDPRAAKMVARMEWLQCGREEECAREELAKAQAKLADVQGRKEGFAREYARLRG